MNIGMKIAPMPKHEDESSRKRAAREEATRKVRERMAALEKRKVERMVTEAGNSERAKLEKRNVERIATEKEGDAKRAKLAANEEELGQRVYLGNIGVDPRAAESGDDRVRLLWRHSGKKGFLGIGVEA